MPGRGILDGATLPAFLPHWIGADDPSNAAAVVQVDTGVESGLRFGSQAPVDGAPTASGLILQSKVSGDSNNRFQVAADGTLKWGAGNASPDTQMTRTASLTLTLFTAGTGTLGLVSTNNPGVDITSSGQIRFYSAGNNTTSRTPFVIGGTGDIGTATVPFTVNGAASASADLTQWQTGGTTQLRVLASGQLKSVSGNETTGAGSALLGANSPASTLTAPYTWLKFTSSDGSQVYVPAWK